LPVSRVVKVLLVSPRTSDFQRVLKLSCCLSCGHHRVEGARVSDGGRKEEGGGSGEREGGKESESEGREGEREGVRW